MTSKHFHCCELCLAELCKTHTNSARMWMDLCAYSVHKGQIMTFKSEDMTELNILENKGYLVTTESPGRVIIKMNGHFINEENDDFFCLRYGDHDE